jgi:peptide/nickel transport system substrate-binding protein
MFQEDLEVCGVEVELENLPAAELYAQGPVGPLFGRRFDMGSFAWLTGVEPRCDLYLSELIPTEDKGWAGQNDSGFMNAEFDAACNRAMMALPGSEDYVAGHLEAQRIFSEQLPGIPLFMRLKVAVTRADVVGFEMDPTEASELWNIELLDVDR